MMRTKLLLTSLLMAAALPCAALAQDYDRDCVQSNNDARAAGTVLGAIGGAVIGGAVAGRHDRGAGVVIGGVGGAVAGNAIAGSTTQPCPDGYYRAPRDSDSDYAPRASYDESGFWAGAPHGLHERYDFMQSRIDRAASAGWIRPHEVDRAYRELSFIRSEDQRLRAQSDGHLRPEDREYLEGRLDSLSQRLNWAQHSG